MSHFQVDRNKNSKGTNQLTKQNPKKKAIENQSKDDKMRLQIRKWTSFYRLNIHRFIEHYLGVELYLFQKILMYFMNINTYVMIVASRGLSKSWMIALFCIARCILYPNTKVVVASGVKKQARLIITEKIEKDFMVNYPNIAREIKTIRNSANETTVFFHNGSTIEAVTSNDNSRGYRGNILILEEFRMIVKETLDTVLIPFLNVNRQPPYLKKEEYEHLSEENIEIYISSAFFESHWMWKAMQSARDAMIKGVDNMFFAMDYLLPLHHGLLSKKRIDNIKNKKDFDEIGLTLSPFM